MARLRTARGVAAEEAVFISDLKPGTYVALSYVDDPNVWHKPLVNCPSLGDRAAAITLWSIWLERVCDFAGACDVVLDGGASSSLASLMKDDAYSRLTTGLSGDVSSWMLSDVKGSSHDVQSRRDAEEVGVAVSPGETWRFQPWQASCVRRKTLRGEWLWR